MKTSVKRMCRFLSAMVAFLACISCDGNNPTDNSAFNILLSTRNVLSIDESTLRVEVRVNGAAAQIFFVRPGETQILAPLTGVQLNENNSVQIIWTELYNGYDVQIARQSQMFFADGNTTIDAPHQRAEYDYDLDGVSNYDERQNNTCVWDANELCRQNGQIDIPASGSVTQNGTPTQSTPPVTSMQSTAQSTFNYDGAEQILNNGDFSSGIGAWFSDSSTLQIVSGALCATLTGGDERLLTPILITGELYDLDPGNYLYEFDIKSSTNAQNLVVVGAWHRSTSTTLFDQYLDPLTTQWQRRTIPYNQVDGVFNNVNLTFQAVIQSSPITYCVDNIRIYKERQQ